MSQQSDLFFYDQGNKRRRYKRYRKPPELLPFSVRLTGLSGAVRVEAYLKQQQQKAGEPQGKESQANKAAGEKDTETLDTQSRTGFLGNLLHKELDREADGRKQVGKTPNLPDIGVRNFNAPLAIRSFEQLEGDDEEEDTQRFLFEENKFAAPNLLAQLARLIDHIHDKQLEELEEIESTSGQFSRSPTPVPEITVDDSVISETIRSGGVVIPLPDDLHNKLCCNYEELSANAVYVKREWQTASYREQAILQKRLGIMSESQTHVESPTKSHVDFSSVSGTAPDQNKGGDEKSPVKGNDGKDTKRKKSFAVEQVSKADNVDGQKHEDLDLRGQTPTAESGSELQSRRESMAVFKSPSSTRPKTRLERFKMLYNDRASEVGKKKSQSSSQRSHEHFDEEDENQKESDVHSGHGTGQPTVINFSLLSKTCEERGWILHQNDADDLERQTLLEWARGRLQQVIREKELMTEKARELGIDGPLVSKHYGDKQREAALKYKKGVSWAKRFKHHSDEDKRPKFLTSLPDGTSVCYYPSGRVAVCVVNPGADLLGRYTIVYGDTPVSPMLAAFVPSGQGCCYHKNGSIRFVSTAKFGVVMEDDGGVEQKWKWPLGRLQTTVSVQLNNCISLRCISQAAITLYFNCQSETAKFQVGATSGAKSVKLTELGYLQTEFKFSSHAALQSMKPKLKKKEDRRRRKTHKAKNPDALTEEILEQRQKELEEKFPERKEMDLDAPWQMELYKLQRKVKGLIYDWMEHYRVAVGISTPIRISSRAKRRSMSHSARSVPGSLSSGFQSARASLRRSPSAPPVPHPKGKPWERSRTQYPIRPHSSANKGKFGVRIDESHGISIEVPTSDALGSRMASKVGSAVSGHSPSHATARTPFRCGVIQQARSSSPPKSGCPVALRAEIMGVKYPQCRCDRRRIPLVTDLEYDAFICEQVPKTQLLVVSVTSSVYHDANPCDSMLDQLFHEKNRNRSLPCVQAQYDPFRLVRYDISTASRDSSQSQPLLLRRHNAIPGMFLMYTGGRLLFADHIFNGYGNAKKDFLKQIMKTRKDALEGKALPADFRLSPTRGRSGPRSPWGGEIGGVKITNQVLNIKTLTEEREASQQIPRIDSATTTASHSTSSLEIRQRRTVKRSAERGGTHSAASFVNLGLSIDSPYPIVTKKFLSTTETIPEHRRVQTTVW